VTCALVAATAALTALLSLLRCVAFVAADVKRRDTNQYLIASAGNKHVSLWSLDPMTGATAHNKVRSVAVVRTPPCVVGDLGGVCLHPCLCCVLLLQVSVGTAFNRDFTCITFSSDREWLFLGTTSGDFACVNVSGGVGLSPCPCY
jgi:hypothetical protein